MPWIQTYSGIAFKPFEPSPDMISLEDIAHALSMICRFNGHTRNFYSVAEHCVIMSELIPGPYEIHALMHDAAEAYLSDIARPIKPHLPVFKAAEDRILGVIYERFGLQADSAIESAVKIADVRMLVTERQQLMKLEAPVWETLRDVVPYDVKLPCWTPHEAEQFFLERFQKLISGETKILCDKCGASMSWWTVSGLCTKCRKEQK